MKCLPQHLVPCSFCTAINGCCFHQLSFLATLSSSPNHLSHHGLSCPSTPVPFSAVCSSSLSCILEVDSNGNDAYNVLHFSSVEFYFGNLSLPTIHISTTEVVLNDGSSGTGLLMKASTSVLLQVNIISVLSTRWKSHQTLPAHWLTYLPFHSLFFTGNFLVVVGWIHLLGDFGFSSTVQLHSLDLST